MQDESLVDRTLRALLHLARWRLSLYIASQPVHLFTPDSIQYFSQTSLNAFISAQEGNGLRSFLLIHFALPANFRVWWSQIILPLNNIWGYRVTRGFNLTIMLKRCETCLLHGLFCCNRFAKYSQEISEFLKIRLDILVSTSFRVHHNA